MILTGKRVFITGGARRCGAVLVRRFAASGASVTIHCCRSRDEAEALCRSLPGAGHAVVQADFAHPGGAETVAAEAEECDILINNASIFFRPGSAEDLNGEALYRQINFEAPRILLEAWGRGAHLGGGCAVNILDQAVLSPGAGGYWQSRKRLAELTLTLAREWGPRGLRINAVAPGPMLAPAWAPESRMEKTLAALPLHRSVGLDDFAAAVEFLCRNDSVTGAILPVDCGQHLTADMKYEI